MMPLEDAVFAELVNEVLYEHFQSGAIHALYDQWSASTVVGGAADNSFGGFVGDGF